MHNEKGEQYGGQAKKLLLQPKRVGSTASDFQAAGYKFVNSKKGKETRNFSYALE